VQQRRNRLLLLAGGETRGRTIYTDGGWTLSPEMGGGSPNVRVCPAVKVNIADVHKSVWSVTTHLTADDMCALARDLFEAARRRGTGAARIVDGLGFGFTCLGWTPEGLKKHSHEGFALFKELTAYLFAEHFDVVSKPQLGLLQEAAWRLLDSRTRREYMLCAISGCDGRARALYNENTPAFVLLLEKQTASSGKRNASKKGGPTKKRRRDGATPSEDGSEASASSA